MNVCQRNERLFLMSTYIIIGAPTIGVMAFNGIRPLSPGRELIKLQIRAIEAPVSMVTGISER